MPGIRSQACGLLLAAGLGLPVDASERTLRVAVLGKAPPMSLVNAAGKLAGFNVRVAHALCDAMSVRCELTATPLERVVDVVAAGEFDFAAVSLLDTAERRSRILFSKPYYRSSSIWFARPGVEPGAAGIRVAAVTGSAQSRYARTHTWNIVNLPHHSEFPALLTERKADAVLLPMASALTLRQEPSIQSLGLATADLHQMSATMLQRRSRLLLVLALVAGFVGGFVFLIHRHLIQPLQAIDQALSAPGSGQAATPPSPRHRCWKSARSSESSGNCGK